MYMPTLLQVRLEIEKVLDIAAYIDNVLVAAARKV